MVSSSRKAARFSRYMRFKAVASARRTKSLGSRDSNCVQPVNGKVSSSGSKIWNTTTSWWLCRRRARDFKIDGTSSRQSEIKRTSPLGGRRGAARRMISAMLVSPPEFDFSRVCANSWRWRGTDWAWTTEWILESNVTSPMASCCWTSSVAIDVANNFAYSAFEHVEAPP